MTIALKKPSAASKLKLLVYGHSGAGKTTFAGSSALKTLVVSAEAGTMCLADRNNVDVVDITRDDNDAPLPDRAMRLSRLRAVLNALQSGELDHQIVVLDSLSEIAQNVEEHLATKAELSKDAFSLWREYKKTMLAIVKSFRDLDRIVICTALAAEKADDQTGIDMLKPAIAGSVGNQIAAFFDIVALVRPTQDSRELVCHPTPKVLAKDRTGKLQRSESTSLDALLTKINPTKEPQNA